MPLLGKRSKMITSEDTTPPEVEQDATTAADMVADTEGHADEPEATEPADASDDTEGHGLDRMLGMDALAGGRPNRPKQPGDENLKPLTKPWPRLKDESKR